MMVLALFSNKAILRKTTHGEYFTTKKMGISSKKHRGYIASQLAPKEHELLPS
jgi:hypothetical protein